MVDYCKKQLGKPYSLTGDANLADNKFSCVGLAEAAYDSIGKGSLPEISELTGSLPLELFKTTIPVTKVTVDAGDLVDVPVRRR